MRLAWISAGGGLADDRLLYSGGLAHLNVRDGVDGFDPARNTSAQGFARWRFTPPSQWVAAGS